MKKKRRNWRRKFMRGIRIKLLYRIRSRLKIRRKLLSSKR